MDIKPCNTKRGRLTHYTRDGVLTLCNYAVAPRVPDHKLREAPFCRRCERAEERLRA